MLFNINLNCRPVKFHPYTSSTRERIISLHCDTSDLSTEYTELKLLLLEMTNSAGIKAHNDNKIVFECQLEGTKKIVYLGFYDLTFSIGLSYYDENEKEKG